MARFKLIGAEIQGQDVNQSTPTADEQRNEARDAVVYETDDQVEARAIIEAGGFFRNRDNFIAVSRLVDSADPLPASSPFPRKGQLR